MIKGIENNIYLDEATHRYYDRRNGDEYMSVSKFKELFKKKFDPNAAYNCAGKGEYEGMTAEEVKESWEEYKEERIEKGNYIHDAIELFQKTTEIKDPKNKPWLLSIASQYKDYYRLYDEHIVYDEENKLAGKADRLCLVTSSSKGIIDITDWKTYASGVLQYKKSKSGKIVRQYMLHCLSHLMDCNYSDVAIQLSTYAYMVEKLTGRKIGQLNCHWINSENPLINTRIPVPYLKYEVEAALQYKKQNAIIINPEPKKSVMDEWDII